MVKDEWKCCVEAGNDVVEDAAAGQLARGPSRDPGRG